jgi:hypothetical protein
VEADVAALLATEAENLLPFGDVPFYEDGIDRVYVLRRYVHCNEMLKRLPQFEKVDRSGWSVNYALQPGEQLL